MTLSRGAQRNRLQQRRTTFNRLKITERKTESRLKAKKLDSAVISGPPHERRECDSKCGTNEACRETVGKSAPRSIQDRRCDAKTGAGKRLQTHPAYCPTPARLVERDVMHSRYVLNLGIDPRREKRTMQTAMSSE